MSSQVYDARYSPSVHRARRVLAGLLAAYLRHQLTELAEGVELRSPVAGELGLERADPSGAIAAEPIPDHSWRTKQVRLATKLDSSP